MKLESLDQVRTCIKIIGISLIFTSMLFSFSLFAQNLDFTSSQNEVLDQAINLQGVSFTHKLEVMQGSISFSGSEPPLKKTHKEKAIRYHQNPVLP